MSVQNQSVETLRWRDGKLEMIDQRVFSRIEKSSNPFLREVDKRARCVGQQ